MGTEGRGVQGWGGGTDTQRQIPNLGRPLEAQVDAGRTPSAADEGRSDAFLFLPEMRAQPPGGHGDDVAQGLQQVEGYGGHAALADVLQVQQAARVLPLRVHVVLVTGRDTTEY